MKKTANYFGIGSRKYLKDVIRQNGAKSIFLVSGKKSYDSLNEKFNLDGLFLEREITRFSDFQPNPELSDIIKGISIFNKSEASLIVAIGGGSAIDMAKAIRVLARSTHSPQRTVTQNLTQGKNEQQLFALPTTSGTGSEVTHFAVVYIDGTKYSLSGDALTPEVSIVDPELTYDLPKSITASSGLDAISQAIESHWSNKSTTKSLEYSRKALELLMPNIFSVVNDPSPQSRSAVSKGAHLAGKAINISYTTASHAISYPITSKFGVPHGFAVALTIPALLSYNLGVNKDDINDSRGIAYVQSNMEALYKLLGYKDEKHAFYAFRELLDSIGAPNSLSSVLSNYEEDVEYIVKNAFNPARMNNNPRVITKNDLLSILTKVR